MDGDLEKTYLINATTYIADDNMTDFKNQ